jgi:outer membrane protein assembly factor BamB
VATSPLVLGDLVLLDVGGSRGRSVAAFDKANGNVRWATQDGEPGYSSPLVIEAAGVRQVLFFTGEALVSVSPDTGEAYWRLPWSTSYDVNAAMPIFVPPDRVFVSSAYDTGAGLYRIERRGRGLAVSEVWRSKVMRNHFNSSVLVDGHLYGFDNGTLKCIEAATGRELWAQRGFGKGSLITVDGFLVVLGEQGQLALARATPEAYHEISEARPLRARTWAQPALADGVLYVRSQQEMVALKVGPRRE